jgi:hypothetical protein
LVMTIISQTQPATPSAKTPAQMVSATSMSTRRLRAINDPMD